MSYKKKFKQGAYWIAAGDVEDVDGLVHHLGPGHIRALQAVSRPLSDEAEVLQAIALRLQDPGQLHVNQL